MSPRSDEGSAAAELPAAVLVLVLLLDLMVGLVRYNGARGPVNTAAAEAARAAASRGVRLAQPEAEAAAARALLEVSPRCESSTVRLDLSRLRPGGKVKATIDCELSFADLGFLPFPRSKTVSGSFTFPVAARRTA